MKLLDALYLPPDTVYDGMDSPIGCLTLLASGKGLHRLLWDTECEKEPYKTLLNNLKSAKTHPTLTQSKQQLSEYFLGQRKTFNLPLVLHGTPFQKQAWKALCEIPYAKTLSYGEQATRMGDKNKARAVGGANGKNPIPIIIPCHRVIGQNGKLVGFGGGVNKKIILLKLEQEHQS